MNFPLIKINHLHTLLLLIPLFLSSCKNEDFDLSEEPLKGKIGGNDWEYTTGAGAFGTTSNSIIGKIFNIDTSEPCGVVNTIRPHLSLAVPAVRGNYTLSVDNVEVRFNLEGGTVKYTATGGFVHIVDINSQEVIGYISADFDDNNTVQGSFYLRICN